MRTFITICTIICFWLWLLHRLDAIETVHNQQNQQLVALQNELIALRLADKARIESDIANLTIDSIVAVRNAWTSDDKIERKMLIRQARFVKNKIDNLKQALGFVPDSIVFIETATIEIDQEQTKPQISFQNK